MDRNVLHLSHEGADLEDPMNEPPKDLYLICKNPYNCPHGRPVLVNFTKSDMEKMFRRIQ